MKLLLIIFGMMLCVSVSENAMAQDAGYVPPPMFEEQPPLPPPAQQTPKTPAVIKQDGKALIAPRVSPRVDYNAPAGKSATPPTEVKKMAPIVEGRSSPQIKKKEDRSVPVPPKKPGVPISAEQKTEPSKPEKAETKAPVSEKPKSPSIEETKIQEPAAAIIPISPKPANVVKHEGFVKGPKTMPAVPTANVDSVAVFAPEQEKGLTILERHQRQVKAEKDEKQKIAAEKEAVKKAEAEKAAAPPEGYEKTSQDALKKILPYEAGAVDLDQADMKAVSEGIASELSKRSDWRVQIRAYASSLDGALGSDKRISLGRAMSLRKSLVDQGVAPEKIDVRAEGSSVEAGQLSDRVDIYLFSPAKTAKTR